MHINQDLCGYYHYVKGSLSLRNVNENVQLQVDAVHDCHVVQYERKLLSLEARKRRQRHLTYGSAGRKKTWGGEAFSVLPLFSKLLFDLLMPLFSLPHSLVSSKVQARIAFSAYLQRVQQRLLAESRASSIPAWPDRDNDQMELVIRFLKRAARNLQQDIKVVSPDPHLPLQDCKRLLSQQLGEFILCYNKETEHMVRKLGNSEEKGCVNYSIFEEYITTASESSLEEVLTFYTQKNKSASVFLGTKDKSVKKDTLGINFPGDSSNCETFGCFIFVCLFLLFLCIFLSFLHSKGKKNVSHLRSGAGHLRMIRAHCGKTNVCQELDVCCSSSALSSTATASSASILHADISIKCALTVSPFTFGFSVVTGSVSKSNSVATFRELHSLSAQALANQQSFISALQKLAERQVARRCASSSHINLLTQHVRLLCLYRGVAAQLCFYRFEPLSSHHHHSLNFRPPKEDVWGVKVQTVSDTDLKQHHHPAQTSYPLQFAVHQLQQQRLKSQQFPDQDRFGHQILFPIVPIKSSSCTPSTLHAQPNPSHGRSHHHTCVSPTIAPKPPSVAREGQTRKTASKRLIR
uniref:Uncharacterized protein n=1 Tax=Oryzias melastigma TaxID=30732 RepID=A0A3B3CME0_ORYME